MSNYNQRRPFGLFFSLLDSFCSFIMLRKKVNRSSFPFLLGPISALFFSSSAVPRTIQPGTQLLCLSPLIEIIENRVNCLSQVRFSQGSLSSFNLISGMSGKVSAIQEVKQHASAILYITFSHSSNELYSANYVVLIVLCLSLCSLISHNQSPKLV